MASLVPSSAEALFHNPLGRLCAGVASALRDPLEAEADPALQGPAFGA